MTENSTQSKRQLAAIMFTDMVGYSQQMQKDEEEFKAAAMEHQRVLCGRL